MSPQHQNYRDALYASYVTGHRTVINDASTYAQALADVVPRLPSDRAARILDVGCGEGRLLRVLADVGYHQAAGIDVSAEQIALAQRQGTSRVEQADLVAYAEAHAGAFDAVIAIDLVEHFDRDQVVDTFTALGQLLKPGGVLVLQTPNGCSPYAGRIQFSDLTHGVIYTDRSLRQVGHAAGFASFAAYPVRPSGSTRKATVRRLLWRAIEVVLKVPLIVETGELRGHIVTQNLIGVGRKG